MLGTIKRKCLPLFNIMLGMWILRYFCSIKILKIGWLHSSLLFLYHSRIYSTTVQNLFNRDVRFYYSKVKIANGLYHPLFSISDTVEMAMYLFYFHLYKYFQHFQRVVLPPLGWYCSKYTITTFQLKEYLYKKNVVLRYFSVISKWKPAIILSFVFSFYKLSNL